MAQRETIIVRGLRELIAAADASGGATKRGVRDALRHVGDRVRDEAQEKMDAFQDAQGKTVHNTKFGVSVRRTGSIFVEERKRKTTGLHPEFGTLQMKTALLPALADNARTTEVELEAVVNEITALWL